MQPKDQMHPDDMRNLIIFAVLSIVLWLAYDQFILSPKMEKIRETQKVAQQQIITEQKKTGMRKLVTVPREESLKDDQRIPMENDLLEGSINLTGARLDDLNLKTYFKTVEKKEEVHILSPINAPFPKYIEQGWVTDDPAVKVPDDKTVWQVADGDRLTDKNSVLLRWNNGQGVTFEQVYSLNRDYAFTVVRRIINNTGKDLTFYPYALIVRRGVPEDFENRWIVHEGPLGYFGAEFFEKDFGKMEKEPQVTEKAEKGWIGLTTKNWFTALVPPQGEETIYRMTYTKAAGTGIKDRYQVDYRGAAMVAPVGGMAQTKLQIFAGAKKLKLLERYEKEWDIPHFDLAVDFGLFYFLTRPFFFILNFFYGFVGNFGVAIILFTICLRICVFPLANTSFKSFAKMRQIGPQMQELKEKYPDDKQKMQQELVKLYQKEQVNPMAGCLPILIQIPIFFSLFKVLSNTIEMRHAPFFGWIQDLSAPDPTSVFNLFGLIPWDLPQFLMIGAWPCLMLVTMLLQRTLSPPPTDRIQAQIIGMMPWVMTFVLSQFAAGLVIYWTFNNLLSVLQQYIIMRRMGVEVDVLGNLLKWGKGTPPAPDPKAEAEAVKTKVESETVPQVLESETSLAPVSKPKPKKKKKKS